MIATRNRRDSVRERGSETEGETESERETEKYRSWKSAVNLVKDSIITLDFDFKSKPITWLARSLACSFVRSLSLLVVMSRRVVNI